MRLLGLVSVLLSVLLIPGHSGTATQAAVLLANQPPTWGEGGFPPLTIGETHRSGQTIANLWAEDPDDDPLTFSLSGDDASYFAVSATAVISVAPGKVLDYESKIDYSFAVIATDPSGASDTLDIALTLTDVDEPPKKPDPPEVTPVPDSSNLRVTWNAPGTDGPDINDYDVRYGELGAAPSIDHPHTGTATSTVISGLEDNTTYLVQVRAANEEGTGYWSQSVRGTTGVAPPTPPSSPPAAPAALVVVGGAVSLTVAENTPRGTELRTFVSTGGDRDTRTWSLTGPDAGLFAISSGGVLSTAAVLDHEESPIRSFAVDVDDGTLSGAVPVEVTVTDVEEPPSVPDAPVVAAEGGMILRASWTAPANNGPQIFDYDVRYRESIATGWIDQVHLDASTTSLFVVPKVGTTYEVQVRAKNAEGTSGWSAGGTGSTTATGDTSGTAPAPQPEGPRPDTPTG